MLVGAPGTGKSTLARRLARTLEADLVSSDRVRRQLFPEPRYTGGEHAAVFGWCHTVIRSCLKVGKAVVFDATNLDERNRRRVYDIVEECLARLVIVWAAAPPRVVQDRMLRRHDAREADDLSEADWDVHLELARKTDPIRQPHLVVNTAVDLEPIVRVIVARALGTEAEARPARELVSVRPGR
jgi:predicted kinase